MIFDICFLIFNFFLLFSIFTFSKQSFLGIFDFWLKTPQNYKSCSKNGKNHQFALLSFMFHKKNPLFDVDLFSRTFDMESPLSDIPFKVIYPFEWHFILSDIPFWVSLHFEFEVTVNFDRLSFLSSIPLYVRFNFE